MKRVVVIATMLACMLANVTARADNAAASAAAEKLFREGKAFFAASRYEEAAEKFRASQEIEPSVGALLSLGDVYRAQSKVASAWSAYVAARDLANTKNDERASDAQQRAAEIAPRLPRLTVRFAVPSNATVTDNGLRLPPASFGTALPVDPGPHVIVATAPGRRTFRTTATLAEGQTREVVVPELEREQRVVERERADASDDTGNAGRRVGLGLLGSGGVVAAAGLVFGGIAIAKWSSVTSTCPGKVCDSEAARASAVEEANTAQTFAAVSTISVAIGAVAMVTGLVFFLQAPAKTTGSLR